MSTRPPPRRVAPADAALFRTRQSTADIRTTILTHLIIGDNETETAWRVAYVAGNGATSGKRPADSTAGGRRRRKFPLWEWGMWCH